MQSLGTVVLISQRSNRIRVRGNATHGSSLDLVCTKKLSTACNLALDKKCVCFS